MNDSFIGICNPTKNDAQLAFTATGDFIVDWGDGSPIEQHIGRMRACHNYVPDKAYIVMISPQAEQRLISIEIGKLGFTSVEVACPLLKRLVLNSPMLTEVKICENDISDFSFLFADCSSMTEFPKLDTANGTDFLGMYGGCSSATEFPLIDTANGKYFLGMYRGCSSAVIN